jgi:CheY-like chemotaxis protein
VARILICEPHADIRTMLSFVVRRIGHEPVVSDGSRAQLVGVDAIVLEPGNEEALEIAAWTHEHAPNVAIVCTSIFPPSPETEALSPDAYLVKPFALYRLENALSAALARRAALCAVKTPEPLEKV